MLEYTDSLRLWVPFLPPSENRIRVHRRQGGQVYSKEARDFQTLFADHLRTSFFTDLAAFVQGHTEKSLYVLRMVFHFDTVINSGWAKNQAKTLYKKFDVGNRRKLIEDCLSTALDIDDSVFFEVQLVKRMSQTGEGVEILLTRAPASSFGVPDVRRIQQK